MGRPYPSHVRKWEEQIYDLRKAATHLDRVNSQEIENDMELPFDKTKEELREKADELYEKRLEQVTTKRIREFVQDNKEKAKTLIQTDSFDKKKQILTQIKEEYLDELEHSEKDNDQIIKMVEKQL